MKLIIAKLYNLSVADVFKQSFPVILTDNGSEFKNAKCLELLDDEGNQRTKIFCCNPMASYQKPRVEKNHEYIRYIITKGISFNNRTQEDITFMMNNINSTARASLNAVRYLAVRQFIIET